jgi:tetratricopeptide (TPR) repeat protein
MSQDDRLATRDSLRAYVTGDLLGALEKYPESAADSIGGKLYRAGVLLGVGRVDEARARLSEVAAENPSRRALERMIAAVKFNEKKVWDPQSLTTSGEAMAESYYLQSRSDLNGAREAARLATRITPKNGYAWTRLAELEFSFSRTKEATAALETALRLTPKNAQAHALKGFVLSADNLIEEARQSFEEAVRLDGALGNGWLGLGLTKIKRGDLEGGRGDLQTAATVEPTVSGFHSYLGKAFQHGEQTGRCTQGFGSGRKIGSQRPDPVSLFRPRTTTAEPD